MAKYVKLSVIDDELITELKPILDVSEYEYAANEIYRDPRIGEMCDALMEILDVDYDEEENFHVLSPELIDRIVAGLEERQGEWGEGIQFKSGRLIEALKEQRDTFAFEAGQTLVISWAD